MVSNLESGKFGKRRWSARTLLAGRHLLALEGIHAIPEHCEGCKLLRLLSPWGSDGARKVPRKPPGHYSLECCGVLSATEYLYCSNPDECRSHRSRALRPPNAGPHDSRCTLWSV